jgi:hypothetical protein
MKEVYDLAFLNTSNLISSIDIRQPLNPSIHYWHFHSIHASMQASKQSEVMKVLIADRMLCLPSAENI